MTIPQDRARFVAQFTSRPKPAPPLSVCAVAGLVLSLLGVSLLGALFAAFALQDIRDGRRSGRPAARVGFVLGVVGCALWGILLAQVVNPAMLR